jgi:hypothetical protein
LSSHFEARHALGSTLFSGASDPAFNVWMRHRDSVLAPGPRLARRVALADVVPTPALALTHQIAPVSTMTWSIDMVLPDEGRDDLIDGRGWHLLTSRTDAISNGYSSQQMTVWRAGGTQVLSGRQVVAFLYEGASGFSETPG